MNKSLNIFFAFLISYSLLACSSKQKQLDIFKSSSCNLPCWNGIILGQTTEQDLLLILKDLQVVNKKSIGAITASGVFESRISFRIGEKRDDGQYPGFAFMYIKNGKVASMEFVGGFELTIDEIIGMFGEPDYVYTTYSHNGDVDLRFFMPKKGAVAILTKTRNNAVISTAETLEIIDPNLYSAVIQSIYTFDGDSTPFYQWVGFGDVYDTYPPK
jgi:hypothetical protein